MTTEARPRVAFLGLGTMGGGMARRLVSMGFPVSVWNRSRDKAQPFAQLGARVTESPEEAAATADVVISMVADDAASLEVWCGAHGALSRIRPGSLLIESSTVSPPWVIELAGRAKAHGCELIDAPVTGSRVQAASGDLLFVAGGDAAVVARARPLFAAMGSRGVVHAGPLGSGARLKLINNFVCGVQAAALAEAIVLMERGGLNLATALPVLQDGAPGSPLVKGVGNRMATRDYGVNFMLGLMRKDLSYAIAEGQRHGVALETARAALGEFEHAAGTKWNDADFAAIVEVLRQ
jgi:3-hydroxyisobutyrate dehydrogenase